MLPQEAIIRGPFHNSLGIKVTQVCLKSCIIVLPRHNDVTDKTQWSGYHIPLTTGLLDQQMYQFENGVSNSEN